MFIHRVRGFPAPGKVPEFRATLEEWVKKRQGQGIETSLARQLFARSRLKRSRTWTPRAGQVYFGVTPENG